MLEEMVCLEIEAKASQRPKSKVPAASGCWGLKPTKVKLKKVHKIPMEK